MGSETKIEWADSTWSPVSGCTRTSPGCDNCYIERTPPFRMAHRRFDGEGVGSTTGVQLHPERLEGPLHWRKPRKVFVCSTADLFHDQVPDEYIAQVFNVMAQADHHTYQVLTKRHGRMRSLLTKWHADGAFGTQPLSNVWLGVSAENQQWADIRIPALLDTPAAVRFVSAEPLLGPIDLSRFLDDDPEKYDVPPLHWVIVGGESGRGARPMHPDWARSICDQCQAAGVAFLFKQHGEWVPESMWLHSDNAAASFLSTEGRVRPLVDGKPTEPPMSRGQDITIRRVGKHRAGRLLDGRTWDEYPDDLLMEVSGS